MICPFHKVEIDESMECSLCVREDELKEMRANSARNIFWAAKQDFEISRYPNWSFEDYMIEAWKQINKLQSQTPERDGQ